MIEETLQALKAKSRVNTANNSPRSSPVHLQHNSPIQQQQLQQQLQQQQQQIRHLSSSSLDPTLDRSVGSATAASDDLSESDKGESASGFSISIDTDASPASRNNSFKLRNQKLLAADCLPPEMQQILAKQLEQQMQQQSEEDRRIREQLEQKLAEETRLRQVMEVQLREKRSAAAQARPLTRLG